MLREAVADGPGCTRRRCVHHLPSIQSLQPRSDHRMIHQSSGGHSRQILRRKKYTKLLDCPSLTHLLHCKMHPECARSSHAFMSPSLLEESKTLLPTYEPVENNPGLRMEVMASRWATKDVMSWSVDLSCSEMEFAGDE